LTLQPETRTLSEDTTESITVNLESKENNLEFFNELKYDNEFEYDRNFEELLLVCGCMPCCFSCLLMTPISAPSLIMLIHGLLACM